MKITILKANDLDIAVVSSDELLINDVQSALDLMATVQYETGSNRIILPKSAVCEEFFNLRTRLAGEILQKFINYQVKVAFIGDYSGNTSNSLRDFIYESNQSNAIFFLADEKAAVEKLSMV